MSSQTNLSELGAGPTASQPTSEPAKTPFYQAIHAARYQRQELIREIEHHHGRPLICYIGGLSALMSREDIVGFADLLHNVAKLQPLDLMLHTIGGDVAAAEKVINMLRTKVGPELLRVIVPDFAKSAGTLMTLGADKIVMSDTSELGPIDPQVVMADGNGNHIQHSVQNYLDAYEHFSALLRKDHDDFSARMMLQKLDPATIKLFENIKNRARVFAGEQLKRGMFRNGGNWSQAADALIDTKRWQTHDQVISWQDAADERIGLVIDYLPPESPIWQLYWQLYCLQRLSITDRQKLFESALVSIALEASGGA